MPPSARDEEVPLVLSGGSSDTEEEALPGRLSIAPAWRRRYGRAACAALAGAAVLAVSLLWRAPFAGRTPEAQAGDQEAMSELFRLQGRAPAPAPEGRSASQPHDEDGSPNATLATTTGATAATAAAAAAERCLELPERLTLSGCVRGGDWPLCIAVMDGHDAGVVELQLCAAQERSRGERLTLNNTDGQIHWSLDPSKCLAVETVGGRVRSGAKLRLEDCQPACHVGVSPTRQGCEDIRVYAESVIQSSCYVESSTENPARSGEKHETVSAKCLEVSDGVGGIGFPTTTVTTTTATTFTTTSNAATIITTTTGTTTATTTTPAAERCLELPERLTLSGCGRGVDWPLCIAIRHGDAAEGLEAGVVELELCSAAVHPRGEQFTLNHTDHQIHWLPDPSKCLAVETVGGKVRRDARLRLEDCQPACNVGKRPTMQGCDDITLSAENVIKSSCYVESSTENPARFDKNRETVSTKCLEVFDADGGIGALVTATETTTPMTATTLTTTTNTTATHTTTTGTMVTTTTTRTTTTGTTVTTMTSRTTTTPTTTTSSMTSTTVSSTTVTHTTTTTTNGAGVLVPSTYPAAERCLELPERLMFSGCERGGNWPLCIAIKHSDTAEGLESGVIELQHCAAEEHSRGEQFTLNHTDSQIHWFPDPSKCLAVETVDGKVRDGARLRLEDCQPACHVREDPTRQGFCVDIMAGVDKVIKSSCYGEASTENPARPDLNHETANTKCLEVSDGVGGVGAPVTVGRCNLLSSSCGSQSWQYIDLWRKCPSCGRKPVPAFMNLTRDETPVGATDCMGAMFPGQCRANTREGCAGDCCCGQQWSCEQHSFTCNCWHPQLRC